MVIFIIGGLFALVWGSDLTVNSAISIAKTLGISERIIGLTIVAIGTSLPELVTCIIAALKKAVTQFNAMRLSDTKQKQVRTTVVNTIQLVLADAESGEYVDSDYVKDNYMESLQTVKKLLNKDMDKQERSDFISRVSASVDDETFNILADFFLSEETKEDYLG